MQTQPPATLALRVAALNKARLDNRWGCSLGHAFRSFNPPSRFNAYPRPRVMLGICAFHVERRIPMKMRVRDNCLQFINQLVANSTPTSLLEHVRQKRTALKMSQKELGKLVGMSNDTISKLELGLTEMRPFTRAKFVKWLGFDPENPTS